MSGDANINESIFTALEIDTIGEIMNISMGSAATAASSLLDNKVEITTPIVNIVEFDKFEIKDLTPAVAVEIKYVEGITGSNILILRKDDARVILGQMMNTELPEDFEFDEISKSAICELMNQMMGASATVLSCFLGRSINISTPVTVPITGWNEYKKNHLPVQPHLLTIQFTISIKDVMQSDFISIMEIGLARDIVNVSLDFESAGKSEPVKQASPPPQTVPDPSPIASAPSVQDILIPHDTVAQSILANPEAAAQAAVPPPAPQPMPQQPYPPAPQGYPYPQYAPPYPAQQPYPAPSPGYGYPHLVHAPAPTSPISIKDYEYSDLGGGGGSKEAPSNLDLIMNVPLTVTVELGRCKRKIKDILEFGQGTIVELDKQAGSQVDVIVNGQLIAQGDVVVVDDNFSIRITEILKARDALTML